MSVENPEVGTLITCSIQVLCECTQISAAVSECIVCQKQCYSALQKQKKKTSQMGKDTHNEK